VRPGLVVLVLVAACSGGGGGSPPRPTAPADLSGDHRLLAVDTHTTLYVYRTGDPGLRGEALVADLIARPPRWTVPLDRAGGSGPVNAEGVAFGRGGHDLVLLAENRDVLSVPAAAYER
jgi:hypothetical protein